MEWEGKRLGEREEMEGKEYRRVFEGKERVKEGKGKGRTGN